MVLGLRQTAFVKGSRTGSRNARGEGMARDNGEQCISGFAVTLAFWMKATASSCISSKRVLFSLASPWNSLLHFDARIRPRIEARNR